jgi:tRNA (guanine-N7-)-methyltransferase
MTSQDDTDLRSSEIRSFGRKRARKPSPRGERLWRDVLPKVTFPLTSPTLASPLWLEIGFGGAEHLLWQAQHNPAVTLIGCEPFEDGVIKALAGIEERALSNVLLHPDDARDLLRALPDASLDRAFILFPDPWPKRKHAKRRLVSTPTLDLLARVMKPGAELRVGTDIGDYARTMLLALTAHKAFTWPALGPDDWRIRPDDWPETRYEQKAAREGRTRYYFRFQRT